jgi:peptide/nickel transport system permease protein
VTGRHDSLLRFTLRRLAWALVTAWVASLIAFVLFWAVPNVDPAWHLGGGVKGTDETRAMAREAYGLNEPLPTQYVLLMKGIFTGSVECYFGCANVRSAFLDRLPVTFWVVVGAGLIAIALGTCLALVCVRHHGRRLDHAIVRAAAILSSVPSLVLAALLWTYLCRRDDLFPFEGYVGLTADPLRWAWHLVLPWLAAGLPFAGAYALIIRASLLETRSENWVRAARAKGLPERTVVRRHVLRNGLAPTVGVWGLDLSHAFGGFILYVETVFGIPGVGQLTEQSLSGLDLPPVVALAIWLAVVVVVISAVIDVLAAAIDPRLAAP